MLRRGWHKESPAGSRQQRGMTPIHSGAGARMLGSNVRSAAWPALLLNPPA
jgi:hypothetical protein